MVAASRPFFPMLTQSQREKVLENALAEQEALYLQLAASVRPDLKKAFDEGWKGLYDLLLSMMHGKVSLEELAKVRNPYADDNLGTQADEPRDSSS